MEMRCRHPRRPGETPRGPRPGVVADHRRGPHNEAALVDIARASTAQQLDRLVAATARADKIWDHGFAAAQLAGRSLQTGFDYDNVLYTTNVRLTPTTAGC
ncbi:MAG TPA: hypothetical protein VM282_23055 [Acidimicrobiales bacterium]|nr:hypothetical protein [Acidimicrobiales bacterium]